MIELGDKVKDVISGMVGVVISRTQYINGCIQYGVQPPFKTGATEMPSWNVDEKQLTIISKKVNIKKKSKPGGPTTKIK